MSETMTATEPAAAPATSPRVTLDAFQENAVQELGGFLAEHESALLVAPTGAGKTGIVLTTADRHNRRPDAACGRTLFLTHRQNLVNQIFDQDQETGIAAWENFLDEMPGSYASHRASRGEPAHRRQGDARIVIGMVQTIAESPEALKALGDYDLVVVDECHHMYDELGDEAGDGAGRAGRKDQQKTESQYQTVIDHLRGRGIPVKVLGATATDYRDGGELHRELREAPQHLVTYRTALDQGRILPPKTVEVDYRMPGGVYAQKALDEMLGGLRDKQSAKALGSKLKKLRGDTPEDLADFARQVADKWSREAGERKTLVFADRKEEMYALQEAFNARSGVRAEVMYSGRPGHENDDAMRAYRRPDGANALVSIRMIGEGTDLPQTGCVVIASGCPTRAEYAQIIGRASRTHSGKAEGDALVMDFSAASRRWGRMEEQIELQERRHGLQRADRPFEQRAALERVVYRPDPDLPVMVFPGREGSAFAVETGPGTVRIFWYDREATKGGAKKAVMKHATPSEFAGYPPRADVPIEAFAEWVGARLEKDAGWHARNLRPDGDLTRSARSAAKELREAPGMHVRDEAARVVSRRAEALGRVGDLGCEKGRAATAAKQVADAGEGRADGVAALQQAIAQQKRVRPRLGRAQNLQVSGVVADHMADLASGEARQALRGASVYLRGDLRNPGLQAMMSEGSPELQRLNGRMAAVFRRAERAFAKDGREGLAELAGSWSSHCQEIARPVKRQRQEAQSVA